MSLRLMEEILHQLVWLISHNLQGFIHPRWCRISSINSVIHYPYSHEEASIDGSFCPPPWEGGTLFVQHPQWKQTWLKFSLHSRRIHVWYICLHVVDVHGNVGKNKTHPYHPCMVYLPTFVWILWERHKNAATGQPHVTWMLLGTK